MPGRFKNEAQEMLRIERIFEPDPIAEELDTCNRLIPDGANLKATMLIEYDDVEQRRRELERLRDVGDLDPGPGPRRRSRNRPRDRRRGP